MRLFFLFLRGTKVVQFMVDDRPADGKSNVEKINELLKTGKYTVLHVKQDSTNVLRTIYVLGKIKK